MRLKDRIAIMTGAAAGVGASFITAIPFMVDGRYTAR